MYKIIALAVCLSVSALVNCEECDSTIVQKSLEHCNRWRSEFPKLQAKLEATKDADQKKGLEAKIGCCAKIENTQCRNKFVMVSI